MEVCAARSVRTSHRFQLRDHTAALRAKSMPDVTIRDALWVLAVSEGRFSDHKITVALMKLPVPPPRPMLADRGYDGDCFRQNLLIYEILPVMPSGRW